jgi:hypothetical protein
MDNQSIAEHYTHGSLERAIFEALSAAGKDLDHLEPADLALVDEFHIGGRQATTDFADRLDFGPGLHLLDIGSGLGGASRYFAQERQCRVTGIADSPSVSFEHSPSPRRLAPATSRSGYALKIDVAAGDHARKPSGVRTYAREPSINCQVVPRHALGGETAFERCSNAGPIQRLCLQNRLQGLVDAVNDEPRHAVVDHFGR